MNARIYKKKLNVSPIDFPPIQGLGESSVSYQTELPYFENNKVVLEMTWKYILTDMDNNKEHEVLRVKSSYEIPPNEIKTREDVYEFYKDCISNLNLAYQSAKLQYLNPPDVNFPFPPIEKFNAEIDRVFTLLQSQN